MIIKRSFFFGFFVIVSTVLLEACATVEEKPIYVPPTGSPKAAVQPTAELPTAYPTPEDLGCYRPYTEDSIWNVPIDWSKAKIHPDNAAMMAAFFRNSNFIGSDTSQYSANLYFVSNKTPLVTVVLKPGRSFRDAFNDQSIQYGEPGGTVMMPLPADAVPAPGTDGELAVVNLDTGEEWGLVNGMKFSADRWEAGGVYRYEIHNSGIPPKGFAQRGAGIGSFAGLVRPCEVERGRIGHAVTIAYDYPCAPGVCEMNGWPQVIPPFTKSDGRGKEKYDIPEGARLVVKPEITLEEIEKACSHVIGCVTWVRAMQEYGGFIVDDSGHPKTYAEGDATAHWDRSIWSPEMLGNIPTDWYAVLDWNQQ